MTCVRNSFMHERRQAYASTYAYVLLNSVPKNHHCLPSIAARRWASRGVGFPTCDETIYAPHISILPPPRDSRDVAFANLLKRQDPARRVAGSEVLSGCRTPN